MNATNAGLNTLDALFIIVDRIERIDPVAIGETVINIIATLAAVIIGVASYLYTALLLWWDTNSETIIINTVRLVVNIIDFTREVYLIGAETKRYLTKTLNHAADSAFFTIAAL